MREMVLNHASLVAHNSYDAKNWIVGMVKGMQTVCDRGLAKTHLRHSEKLYGISCAEDSTLYQIAYEMLKTPYREEADFLLTLLGKAPSWDKSHDDDAVADRKLRCEVTGIKAMDLTPEDGAPLHYCAKNDSIAVGFPSDPVWEQDQIDVYKEPSSVGDELDEVAETIDNLTRSEHARTIIERHRHEMREIASFDELWQRRSKAFPNLTFGPDVEHQLGKVNQSDLSSILKRLAGLDDYVKDWRNSGVMPSQWPSKTTDESDSVYQDASLREKRRFASQNGDTELFMLHCRFGNSGRIHLRFNAQTKEVEIGYIGEHLPLR